MDLKEMVRDGKVVRFAFYRDKNLWYRTEDGFEFPVPIDDVGTATFMAEDKAILFMRYIRKQLALVQEALAASTNDNRRAEGERATKAVIALAGAFEGIGAGRKVMKGLT